MADVLEIIDHDHDFGALASIDAFTLREAGTISSDVVIEHENITPYCLDHASQRLIFADTPTELDLSSCAFAFADQKRFATRLIGVPFDELAALADRVAQPEKLVFVFNSGRSGSTLLHQIFNEIDGVISFSELDFFGNLVAPAHRSDDRPRLSDLLQQCVRLFAYPYADRIVAFKFRSDCVDIADLFHRAFPSASNLFLYRNAIDWCASWRRLHASAGWPEVIDAGGFRADRVVRTGRSTEFDRVVGPDEETAEFYKVMLPMWLLTVAAYLRHLEGGVPMVGLRYEDLDQHRAVMLAKVLEHVGVDGGRVAEALRGFDRDSQAGTVMQRKDGKPNDFALSDEHVAAIADVLARQPTPLDPHVVLPGTARP